MENIIKNRRNFKLAKIKVTNAEIKQFRKTAEEINFKITEEEIRIFVEVCNYLSLKPDFIVFRIVRDSMMRTKRDIRKGVISV